VLTNNNTTATGTSSSLPTVLGLTAISSGQKVMFSLTQNTWAPVVDDTGIGIGTLDTVLTNYAGQTAASGALYDDGQWWTNATSETSGLPTFQTNSAVIDVAVDRVNNFIWFRVNNGLWNNNISANPATVTGGIDISSFTGDVYPAYSPYYDISTQIGSQATINSSALSIPAGFTFMGNNLQIDTVYPNSLINMRDQVIDVVGQISNTLPLWMICKQANGQTLGFTPAWVIAYAKPGRGEQLAYYIGQNFIDRLNVIDFEVDRYELDNLLTRNWNRAEQQWGYDDSSVVPHPPSMTTFDLIGLPIFSATTAYQTGQVVEYQTIVGDVRINKIYRCIQDTTAGILPTDTDYWDQNGQNIGSWINDSDAITTWEDDYFTLSNWTYATPPGTTFDGGSLQFTAPVDEYSNTNAYDKYLVFPRRNILG
jgi:hypothetical protein